MKKILELMIVSFMAFGIGLVHNQTKAPQKVEASQEITRVYFEPSANWMEGGAIFGAYGFNDSGDYNISFPGEIMAKLSDTLYYVGFDNSLAITKIIFTRLNPYNGAKWNQTGDIELSGYSKVTPCFTPTPGEWDGMLGEWKSAEIPSPSEILVDYTVVGGFDTIAWDKDDTTRNMVLDPLTRVLSYDLVVTGESLNFKVLRNHTWEVNEINSYYDNTDHSRVLDGKLDLTSKDGNIKIFTGTYKVQFDLKTYCFSIVQAASERVAYYSELIDAKLPIANLEDYHLVEGYANSLEDILLENDTYDPVLVERITETKAALDKYAGFTFKVQQTEAVNGKSIVRIIGFINASALDLSLEQGPFAHIKLLANYASSDFKHDGEIEHALPENQNIVYKGVVADGQTVYASELEYEYCFGFQLNNVPVNTLLNISLQLYDVEDTSTRQEVSTMHRVYQVAETGNSINLLY